MTTGHIVKTIREDVGCPPRMAVGRWARDTVATAAADRLRIAGPAGKSGQLVDLDSERAVVGAMLIDPGAIDVAAYLLEADDFAEPMHARFFQALTHLRAQGRPVNPDTVLAELQRVGGADNGGGTPTIVYLMESCTRSIVPSGIDTLPRPGRVTLRSVPIGGRGDLIRDAVVNGADLDVRHDPVDWLWEGFIARRMVTLLSGLWKSGKSTLLAHLLRSLGTGGELAGQAVAPGRVLYVSEESQAMWARRRQAVGFADNVDFFFRPFRGNPSAAQWVSFAEEIARLVESERYALVVLDTFARLSPCEDENDSSKMQRALNPLHEIAEAGAGVLIVHHLRKSAAGLGQGARGSGALPAFVDILIEFRPFDPARFREDRRRVLAGLGRTDETPAQLVIELTTEGYRVVGSKTEAKKQDRLQQIAAVLPDEPPGMTVDEVHRAHPDTLSVPTIKRGLKAGAEKGWFVISGDGVSADPFRYCKKPDHIGPADTALPSPESPVRQSA